MPESLKINFENHRKNIAIPSSQIDKESSKSLKKNIPDPDKTFSKNSLEVLRRRYLMHDADGNIIETASDLFKRVSTTLAEADANYSIKNID